MYFNGIYMVDRCIKKNINVSKCIYCIFHCICGVFQSISIVFECIYSVIQCISNVFIIYLWYISLCLQGISSIFECV
jgi:hypothetical protein